MQTNWRYTVKTWLPPALIQMYRRRRGDPRADPQFTLPVTTLGDLFPAAHAEVIHIPIEQAARGDVWAVPAAELLTIAALCVLLQPRRVFEIGTYTGESTRVMACNTPTATEIITLDLAPDEFARRVGRAPHFVAGSAFHHTAEAAKITQRYVDAHEFNFTPFAGQCDLVFVDADHRYEAVRADSAQAFRLAQRGGVILWDDYLWDEQHPECAGVTRCLNELATKYPIYRIAGTRFAITRVD